MLSQQHSGFQQVAASQIMQPPCVALLVLSQNAELHWTIFTSVFRWSQTLKPRWRLQGDGVRMSEDEPEYQTTLWYIQQHDYHCTLDKLQQLVIQWLFKLSKANVIGMGKLLQLQTTNIY